MGIRKNRIYSINFDDDQKLRNYLTISYVDALTCHKRLGYVNMRTLDTLVKKNLLKKTKPNAMHRSFLNIRYCIISISIHRGYS